MAYEPKSDYARLPLPTEEEKQKAISEARELLRQVREYLEERL